MRPITLDVNFAGRRAAKALCVAAAIALWCLFCPPSARAADSSHEVIVIGGNPGGVASAITAARAGHKVALFEYHRHLGGMAASGLGKTDIETKEAIGGLFKEFVDRVRRYYVNRYGANSEAVKLCRDGYYYEPSVAERVFDEMVAAEPNISVFKNHVLTEVVRAGNRVVGVSVADRASGRVGEFRAKIFIDATYEGDLAAYAGARYRLGREGRDEFNEMHAGVVYQDHETRTFLAGTTGEGDKRIQAYTFRLCLTTDPANAVIIREPPPDYDRTRYLGYFDDLKAGRLNAPKVNREGLGYFAPSFGTMFRALSVAELPNSKTDVNMNPRPLGFPFSELNYEYPEADWEKREQITAKIRNVTLGLLYFLQNDREIPEAHRALANKYHLAKDEFTDNNNFPWQLYVREARRIVGLYTLSENDVIIAPGLERARIHRDAIMAGEYPMDSFPVRRREKGHDFGLEGYLLVLANVTRPYQIPYRILVPESVDNLLVPVAASTTHVAFSSIRLEPTWMALGQAAGVAAHIAVSTRKQPRDLPVEAVQRTLIKQGQVLTYFSDLDRRAFAFAAMQYLGTKGFFEDYRSLPGQAVERDLAARWMLSALKLKGIDVESVRNESGESVGAGEIRGKRRGDAAAALALLGFVDGRRPFEPDRALTRAEYVSWLHRVGAIFNVLPDVSESARTIEALREQKLGAETWTDPNNKAVRPTDPVLRGEFCQGLFLLLERAGL